jgi:hypothetical protein
LGKIAVCGLGESIKLYTPDYDLTIGVNDIWRIVKTDVVVCLDNPKVFNPDRLKVINECTPQAFYSQMVVWDTRKDFIKINLLDGYPDNLVQFNTPALHKSLCSPFVACEIAYKFYFADEIHLFGVDLINHPHLDKPLCAKIITHFRNLKTALNKKGCDLIIHGEGILRNI